jgi:hypothetical protein
MLERLVAGNPEALRKLNAAIDAINRLGNLQGDGRFVMVDSGPGGAVGRLNVDGVLARAPHPLDGDAGILTIRNDSGGNLSAWSVVGILGMVVEPTTTAEKVLFKNGPIFKVVVPTVGSHEGWFGILTCNVVAGSLGKALFMGVCATQVNMVDALDEFADVKDSDATQLQSATSGAAQILWVESGTGTKWAIVRIGNPSSAFALGDIIAFCGATPRAGSGWLVCNGTNNAAGAVNGITPPDLSDRFIMAAGPVNATGTSGTDIGMHDHGGVIDFVNGNAADHYHQQVGVGLPGGVTSGVVDVTGFHPGSLKTAPVAAPLPYYALAYKVYVGF